MQHPALRFLLAFCALGVAVLTLGNSGGTAAAGNFHTGAPSTGGGTEPTCRVCHNSGNFGQPQIAVTLAAADGTLATTEYVPGETYRVTVAVGYNDVAPAGYGFSSQFLDPANTTAGEAANPSGNTRITNGSNGRTYVEHSMRSTDSLFTFDWTAPAVGGGEVNYYVTANLVNGAAGISGDNGSNNPTIVTLAEGAPSSVRNLDRLTGRIFPNPAGPEATISLEVPVTGAYELRLVDFSGRPILQRRHDLAAGPNAIRLYTAGLPAGIYGLTLTGAGAAYGGRLVVR